MKPSNHLEISGHLPVQEVLGSTAEITKVKFMRNLVREGLVTFDVTFLISQVVNARAMIFMFVFSV